MSILSLLILTLTLTIAYFYACHRSLASRIHPVIYTGTLPSSLSSSLLSIPAPVYTNQYFSIYIQASRRVPRQLLPPHNLPHLFILLLRRTLIVFSHFPKAWRLRSTCPQDARKTFRSSYIQSLDFNEGDLVCGAYRVCFRDENRVEFATADGHGRWVIRYWEEGKEVVFCSESVRWRSVDAKIPLRLENRLVRFLHETMAWWLLDSGVRYLMDLEGEFGPEEEEREDKELVG